MKYLLSCLLFISIYVKAQKPLVDLGLENYKHTLSYTDHKVVFQALMTDRKIKFLDPEKKYCWFSNNEIKSTQGGYSGKLLHGLYTDFYASQNLKEQGSFNMGLKEGAWKNWNEEGILVSQINFKLGIANGDYYFYDTKGKLLESGTNKNGKVNGLQKRYVGADSVTYSHYQDGVLQTKSKKWLGKLFAKNNGSKPKK